MTHMLEAIEKAQDLARKDLELLELAVRMREAQRQFFKVKREGGAGLAELNRSRELEREFDKAAAARFSAQGSLL